MPLDPNIVLNQRLAQPVTAMQQGQQFAQQQKAAGIQNRLGELQIQAAENSMSQGNQPKFDSNQAKMLVAMATNAIADTDSLPEEQRASFWEEKVKPHLMQATQAMGMNVPADKFDYGTVRMFVDKTGGGGDGKLAYQAVPTQKGYVTFNRITGTYETPQGESMMPPQYDPNVIRNKKSAEVQGKAEGAAVVQLPSYVAGAEQSLQLLDEISKHPGLKQAVGKSSMLGLQKVPGTDAYDFMVRLDQMKGKQFMEAYQGLRGGGQITDVEGKKAEQAIARMDNAQSEEAFVKAINDFKDVLRKGIDKAKKEAGVVSSSIPATSNGPTVSNW